jgi:hypothetical protein
MTVEQVARTSLKALRAPDIPQACADIARQKTGYVPVIRGR